MSIFQEKDLVVGNTIMRETSLGRVTGLILAGIVVGSAITGLFFIFFFKDVGTKSADVPSGDQQNQPSANESSISNTAEVLNSITLTNFSGVVTSVENNSLLVKTSIFGEEKKYKVLIDENTKIYKKEANKSASESEDPNLKFSEIPAIVSDISAGSGVEVDSLENIKDRKEFLAKRIIIFVYPPIPAPAELPKPPDLIINK